MIKKAVPDPPARHDGQPHKAVTSCKHDYEFLYSEYESTKGSYLSNFKQIDVFYCRKCLEYRRVNAKDVDGRLRPVWFKG